MMRSERLTEVTAACNVLASEVHFGSGEVKLTGRMFYPETGRTVPGAVICHGFGGCYRTVEEPARMLAEKGIAVLIFDFRGHGKSDGIVDENIVADVVDAWNFLSGLPGRRQRTDGAGGA